MLCGDPDPACVLISIQVLIQFQVKVFIRIWDLFGICIVCWYGNRCWSRSGCWSKSRLGADWETGADLRWIGCGSGCVYLLGCGFLRNQAALWQLNDLGLFYVTAGCRLMGSSLSWRNASEHTLRPAIQPREQAIYLILGVKYNFFHKYILRFIKMTDKLLIIHIKIKYIVTSVLFHFVPPRCVVTCVDRWLIPL